jgi:hypothetical protein
MYLEAKETARLYGLLTEKLGNDTTEAMFKYIDNRTERAVEATIKTLATKDDVANLRKEMVVGFADARGEMTEGFANVRKEMGESRADNIKWMFIFWIGQVGATLAIILLFLKK